VLHGLVLQQGLGESVEALAGGLQEPMHRGVALLQQDAYSLVDAPGGVFAVAPSLPDFVTEESVFASGLHTLSLLFRLFAQSGVIGKCSYAGAEMSLKWVKPVMPGDTIRAVFEVVETRAFKSRPGLGSLTMTHCAINQRDEMVVDCTCTHIIRKRPADPDKPWDLG